MLSLLKSLLRKLSLLLLGLLGVMLLLEGVWFVWHGVPFSGVLMVLVAGAMLAGCAGWLLFYAPPPPITVPKPSLKPVPSSDTNTQADKPASVRIVTRHQRLTDDTPLQSVTPDELRSALLGIGYRRIAGASWQEACADEHWASFCVFLHCERDKLNAGSSDDVDGLYLTREEAEAAVSASPQTANPYTWKVFVNASALQYAWDDRKVLPHLVRAIKQQLFALPDGYCTGTLVELKSWQSGKKACMAANKASCCLKMKMCWVARCFLANHKPACSKQIPA